ncbi:MAG: pirin family protein [Candidatus Pacebacteria bacterium]|nr:pirin family protein [Candidatus Paceibacterota bacterium]
MTKTLNQRKVEYHYHGHSHGPVIRMVSPGDLGERLKPFVFLDYFNPVKTEQLNFPAHPHSGIATLTWARGGDVVYWDNSGQNGTIHAGGIEWMNAGGGAWHQSRAVGEGRMTGFQLWVALPPLVEDGAAQGQYIPPESVPMARISGGDIRVLLGQLEPVAEDRGSEGRNLRHSSSIVTHQDMNYFIVRLDAGAEWSYLPPSHHDVAWAMVFDGDGSVNGQRSQMEVLVLSSDSGSIEMKAGAQESWFVLGTAKRHDYPLVLGRSSVHTNRASLHSALKRIADTVPR